MRLILIVLICSFSAFGQLPIIPEVKSHSSIKGHITLKNYSLKSDSKKHAVYLKNQLEAKFPTLKCTKRNSVPIELRLSPQIKEVEGYQLDISEQKIAINAKTEAGISNGIASLLQLLYYNLELPIVKIEDAPNYEWRGFMLDESRHFFGEEKVKQILDLMALHKLNKFHWHLTDAPGWRIEIKKYPKLTEIGGIGNYSEHDAPAAFYTQKQIKDIVRYAAIRNIEVIPEIDLPGHASAAIRAYPEFSGGGTEKHPEFTFNVGKKETYTFLEEVLGEVAALFPSSYLHMGGDEVSYGNANWNSLPEVKALMEKENLKDLKEVEFYFVNRIKKIINGLGKTMVGWDEIEEANVPNENVVLMWWRHNMPETLETAISKNYPVVLCPRIPYYLDFVNKEAYSNGRKWGGNFGDVKKAYEFPANLEVDLSSATILGFQANMWTERFEEPQDLDFMMWPRLTALSEATWTAPANKDFNRFEEKLKGHTKLYESYNLNYFNYFNPSQSKEPAKILIKDWQNAF